MEGDTAIPDTYTQRFPAANPEGKAKTMARRRNRKPDGHVGRPPNSFMLFRADFVNKGRLPASMSNLNTQAQLGKIIGVLQPPVRAPLAYVAPQPRSGMVFRKRNAAYGNGAQLSRRPSTPSRTPNTSTGQRTRRRRGMQTRRRSRRFQTSLQRSGKPKRPPRSPRMSNLTMCQEHKCCTSRTTRMDTTRRQSRIVQGSGKVWRTVPCPRVIPVPAVEDSTRRVPMMRVISMPNGTSRQTNPSSSSSYRAAAHAQAVRDCANRPQYRSRLNDYIMQLVGRGLSAEEIEVEAAAWERRETASGNGDDGARTYSDSASESEWDSDDDDTPERSASKYRLVPVPTRSFQPRESFARGEPVGGRDDSESRRGTQTPDSPRPMDQDEQWSPPRSPSPPPSVPSPIGRRESAPSVLHRLAAPEQQQQRQARLSAQWYDGRGQLFLPPPPPPTGRRIAQPSNLPPPVFRPVFGAAVSGPSSATSPPVDQRLRRVEEPLSVQMQRSRSVPSLPPPLRGHDTPPTSGPETSGRLPSFSEGFSSFCV